MVHEKGTSRQAKLGQNRGLNKRVPARLILTAFADMARVQAGSGLEEARRNQVFVCSGGQVTSCFFKSRGRPQSHRLSLASSANVKKRISIAGSVTVEFSSVW